MSAMRFSMRQVEKATWVDMASYKNKRISKQRKHMRYRSVVQACILHSLNWHYRVGRQLLAPEIYTPNP